MLCKTVLYRERLQEEKIFVQSRSRFPVSCERGNKIE